MPEAATAKKPWVSKGVIGNVLGLAAMAAGFFGITVDPEVVQELTDNLFGLITAVSLVIGNVMGLWGRIKAKGPITLGDGG